MKRNHRFRRVFVTAIALFCLLGVVQVSGAADKETIVFISDLHLNVDAEYSWLADHADDLAAFLNEVDAREDVAELVILGDLFDEWVVPLDNLPHSLADILTADTNAGIVAALYGVCANPRIQVTYVVGNHDMLSFQTPNRALIAETFPGMHIVSAAPGLGAYSKDDVIWAEHGHRYGLFNAPDTWSRPGGHLPLGYFISRLAASRGEAGPALTTPPEVSVESPEMSIGLLEYEGDSKAAGVLDAAAVVSMFNAIVLWSGHSQQDIFTMGGLDGFDTDPSVAWIADTYDTLFSEWPANQDLVSPQEAFGNDTGGLDTTASLLFEMPDRLKESFPFTPRIILFGHTHHALLHHDRSGERETIYVNTGTWVDFGPMSWVEVRIEDGDYGQRLYEVTLWFHGEGAPRQSGVISASPPLPQAPESWSDLVRQQLLLGR